MRSSCTNPVAWFGSRAAGALAVAAFAAAGVPGQALAKGASANSSGGAGAKTIAPGIDTSLSTKRFFSASRHAVTFSFRLHGLSGPATVTVRLVRRSGNAVLKTWKRTLANSDWHSFHWDGSKSGRLQPDGSYAFRISAKSADGSSIGQASGSGKNQVTMHNYAFPLRGSHTFGDGFGAPRSGHTHQGQDIMASCGTTIVAARGGTVKKNAYQSAAGNYLVITSDGTGQDFVYMHMPHLSKKQEGQHVYTGQQIGKVGQTGDATACHLHFEMWTSPGWYSGGHAFDARPSLDRWDRYS